MLAKIKVCGAPVLVDFALTLPVWICVLSLENYLMVRFVICTEGWCYHEKTILNLDG
jgi:hypothetical protein